MFLTPLRKQVRLRLFETGKGYLGCLGQYDSVLMVWENPIVRRQDATGFDFLFWRQSLGRPDFSFSYVSLSQSPYPVWLFFQIFSESVTDLWLPLRYSGPKLAGREVGNLYLSYLQEEQEHFRQPCRARRRGWSWREKPFNNLGQLWNILNAKTVETVQVKKRKER